MACKTAVTRPSTSGRGQHWRPFERQAPPPSITHHSITSDVRIVSLFTRVNSSLICLEYNVYPLHDRLDLLRRWSTQAFLTLAAHSSHGV